MFRKKLKKRSIRILNRYVRTKPLKVPWRERKEDEAAEEEEEGEEEGEEGAPVREEGESSNVDQSGTMSPIKLSDMKYGDGYRCYVCEKTYSTPWTVRNHLYALHNVKLAGKFTYFNCDLCTPPYRTMESFKWKNHIKSAKHEAAKRRAENMRTGDNHEKENPQEAFVPTAHNADKNQEKENRPEANVPIGREAEEYSDTGDDEVSSKRLENFKKGSIYQCDKCSYSNNVPTYLRHHYYSLHHMRIPGRGKVQFQYFKCTKCKPPFYCMKRRLYDKHLKSEKHKAHTLQTHEGMAPQAATRKVHVPVTPKAAAQETHEAGSSRETHAEVVPKFKKAPPPKEEDTREPFSFDSINRQYHCLMCPYKTEGVKNVVINHLWSKHVIKVDEPSITFYECVACNPAVRTIYEKDYNKHTLTSKHMKFTQIDTSDKVDQNSNVEEAEDVYSDSEAANEEELDVEGGESDNEQIQDNPPANDNSDSESRENDTLQPMLVNKEGNLECGVCNVEIIEMQKVRI